jgi:proteasome lid subunit RPN8/RPN11
VIVPRRVLDEILRHARETQPFECCGILTGTGDRILESARAGNLSDNPARYDIDPRDHFAVRRSARARGLSVVGFYHSHPHSAPYPSETDRREAVYDEAVYVIVGVSGGAWSVRAFRIAHGAIDEVTLQPIDDEET